MLMDEAGNAGRSAPHPQLWRDFLAGLDAKDRTSYAAQPRSMTKETFSERLPHAHPMKRGLCALYAYEYQTPAITKTKNDGLKNFYGLTDERAYEFFRVHETADIYHSQTCEKLIDAIPCAMLPRR